MVPGENAETGRGKKTAAKSRPLGFLYRLNLPRRAQLQSGHAHREIHVRQSLNRYRLHADRAIRASNQRVGAQPGNDRCSALTRQNCRPRCRPAAGQAKTAQNHRALICRANIQAELIDSTHINFFCSLWRKRSCSLFEELSTVVSIELVP